MYIATFGTLILHKMKENKTRAWVVPFTCTSNKYRSLVAKKSFKNSWGPKRPFHTLSRRLHTFSALHLVPVVDATQVNTQYHLVAWMRALFRSTCYVASYGDGKSLLSFVSTVTVIRHAQHSYAGFCCNTTHKHTPWISCSLQLCTMSFRIAAKWFVVSALLSPSRKI